MPNEGGWQQGFKSLRYIFFGYLIYSTNEYFQIDYAKWKGMITGARDDVSQASDTWSPVVHHYLCHHHHPEWRWIAPLWSSEPSSKNSWSTSTMTFWLSCSIVYNMNTTTPISTTMKVFDDGIRGHNNVHSAEKMILEDVHYTVI